MLKSNNNLCHKICKLKYLKMFSKLTFLKQKLTYLKDYNQKSRIHSLQSFPPNCFVKRDDELSFGISGSKLRKYISLIPFLEKNNIQEVVVIGSAYSNNVLGLNQLLIEQSIKPTLFLLSNDISKKMGNYLLTSLFVPQSSIHWISRKNWPHVKDLAEKYIYPSKEKFIIPEGALMPEALLGVITLPLDIIRNEKENKLNFNHIFMEAGSGLTAITTILTFTWLEKQTCIHVLLLADKEHIFIKKLKNFKKYFEKLVLENLSWEKITTRFQLHSPTTAKSFGSINKQILQKISKIAQTEGFLTDPIYSAKLFLEAKIIIKKQILIGNVLIIHSGGGLTLMGFQEQLSHI